MTNAKNAKQKPNKLAHAYNNVTGAVKNGLAHYASMKFSGGLIPRSWIRKGLDTAEKHHKRFSPLAMMARRFQGPKK